MAVKLSALQWLRVLITLAPMARRVVASLGIGVVAFVGVLLDLVGSLEEVYPEVGHGSKKLLELQEGLREAWARMDNKMEEFEEVWPDIISAVGRLVEMLNAWNAFRKS